MATTVSPRVTFREGTNEAAAPCWCKHPINAHATESRIIGCQGGDGSDKHPICGCRWVQRDLEAAGYSFVCGRCARSDHSSHDDHEGLGGLDMLDCKNVNADGSEQCMCRATWPRNERERGD